MRISLADALKILYVDHSPNERKELLEKYGISPEKLRLILKSGNFKLVGRENDGTQAR